MKKNLRNPKGSRDWLPDEVAKQEYVRKSLVTTFEKWGYKPIQTPILINWDTLTISSNKLSDSAFKLIGQQGDILALRADLTTPIARVTAERLKDDKLPFRFYYIGKVFRYQARKATNERELYQIGIELIGAKEGVSDLECLKIAYDSLEKLGIDKYLIIFNHSLFWKELFLTFGETAQLLYKALTLKDLVTFNRILKNSNLSKDEKLFWHGILNIRGGKEVINKLKNTAKKVKKLNLKKLITYFEDIFKLFDKNIEIDLSLTSDIDYYTGIYFEIITPHFGRAIGSGGRYDDLIKKFGLDIPAIGFSFCLEDVLLSLEKQGKSFPRLKTPELIEISKSNIKKSFEEISKKQKTGSATLKL